MIRMDSGRVFIEQVVFFKMVDKQNGGMFCEWK